MLVIFGVAYTVNQVVLNPRNIERVLNDINFTQVIQDTINKQTSNSNMSPELKTALISAFSKVEPVIKARVGIALEDTYAYLKGKGAAPDFKQTLSKSVMNSQFLADLLDKINLSELVDQVVKNQTTSGTEISDDTRNALVSIVDQLEPSLKKQIVAASDPVFKYLLSQNSSIDLKATMRQTLLSDSFVGEAINTLDATPKTKEVVVKLTRDLLTKQIGNQLPQGITLTNDQIDRMATAIEPTFKTGLANSIGPIIDYLLGNRQDFTIRISLSPVLPTLKPVVKEAFVAQLPANLKGLPQANIDSAFEQYFTAKVQPIIANINFNSSDLGLNVSGDIGKALNNLQNNLTDVRNSIDESSRNIEDNLKQARVYVGLFRIVLICIIGLILVMIMGIILIYRNVKDVCRNLGIIFTIYGAIFLVAVLVGKNIALHIINTKDMPQAWHPVPGIILNDVASPLQTVSIFFLVIGILLIVASIVYPRIKQTKEEPAK
jgi:hypothetical protein